MGIVNILIQYKEALFLWLLVTLKICLYTWILWVFLGVILWILSNKYNRTIWRINTWLSTLIAWVPILVLLYWLYFPMQQFLWVNINSFLLAIGCFVIVNMFWVSNVIKDWIENLPKQYIISAKLTGLSNKTTLLKIKLPLIFKHVIWPIIIIIQITMLHASIFASLINVDEIFRQIQRINAVAYKPIELYSILALFFIIISVPLHIFASHLKKKYARDFSERI